MKSTKFAPRVGPRPDTSGSVPLEFDKDFLNRDSRLDAHMHHNAVSRSISRGEGDSGASVSTLSTSAIPLDGDVDDLWHGWDTAEDKIEQFDDIVGFLDEEQARLHSTMKYIN